MEGYVRTKHCELLGMRNVCTFLTALQALPMTDRTGLYTALVEVFVFLNQVYMTCSLNSLKEIQFSLTFVVHDIEKLFRKKQLTWCSRLSYHRITVPMA